MVYKRGKVFYTDFTQDGIRVYKSTGTGNKADALKFEMKERQALYRSQLKREHPTLMLSEAFNRCYKEHWQYKKDGERTLARGKRIVELIGDKKVSDIDLTTVVSMLSDGLEGSQATANRYIAALSTVLNMAYKWGVLAAPVALSRFKESAGRIRIYTAGEEKSITDYFVEHAHYNMAELVTVLIDTGLRLGELLNLEAADVSNGVIRVWVNKGDKPRSVPMTSRVRGIVERRAGFGRVFGDLNHSKVEKAWKLMRHALGYAADKEYIIHALRHTCASRLLDAGVDIYTVKEMLGHSSIKVTERYAHLNPVKLFSAVAALEKSQAEVILSTV